MYLWLVSTIIASYLSERKGYGDRPGLATGLILTILGPIIWLIVPAKPESKWKTARPGRAGRRSALPRLQRPAAPSGAACGAGSPAQVVSRSKRGPRG